jgi:tetratricopeptide (TPR) repeat protein
MHDFKPLVLAALLAFTTLSAAAVDRETVDALYRKAILEDGNLDKTLATLKATVEDAGKSVTERAEAWLTSSELLWRHGLRDPALQAAEQALALHQSAEALLQKARLLDAAGDAGQAREWYEKSLPLIDSRKEADEVRLRLALMSASNGDPQELIEFAHTQEQPVRNRIAVALAILGQQKEALALFRIIAPGGLERFQEQLRVTEWAIRAGEFKRAQAQAWEAAHSTQVVADQRYALALLVEAHREDKTLESLIDRFSEQKNLMPEARTVWIDLLREASRYEEAVALVKEQGGDSPSVETRQLLLRLYREAGRDAEVVAEYRKLLVAEPERLDWPRGLAEYYAGAGDTEAAEKVWRDFLDQHTGNASLVQAGAEAAAQMGFDELAVATLEALIARSEST